MKLIDNELLQVVIFIDTLYIHIYITSFQFSFIYHNLQSLKSIKSFFSSQLTAFTKNNLLLFLAFTL